MPIKKLTKNSGLVGSPILTIVTPIALLASLLISTVIFIILYAVNQQIGFLIALVAVFGALLVAFIVWGYFVYKVMHRIYYENIYETTYTNIKKIVRNDTSLIPYRDVNVKEINELNDSMHEIKQRLENAYLVFKSPDYSSIDLEYVDKNRNIVTFESFKKNLSNIIYISQSFRNIIIAVDYNTNGPISKEDLDRIINLYIYTFGDYENPLFMYGDNDKSIIIYIPGVDSMSRIKEQIDNVVQDSGIIERESTGMRNVAPRYSIVCYPYSTEEYLLSDLRYARRQNKTMNIFMPNRIQNNINQDILMNNTMNLNHMSKIITKISSLDYSSTDNDKNIAILKGLFNDLSNYLDIDEAGIIYLDKTLNVYASYVESDNSTVFKGNKDIELSFVEAVSGVVDEDGSYFFSTRKHANKSIGRQLDYYGFSSGYFQVVKNDDGVTIAIVYFFNRQRDFRINTYLRESFFTLSLRIEYFFEMKEILDYLDLRDNENEYILSMSDYMLYKIDDDFNLTYLSRNMSKYFPGSKAKSPCYKELYGLERPCSDCPLKTFKLKNSKIKNNNFETSLVLNDRKTHNRSLLISRVKDEETKRYDIFDSNLLIYSYYSLYEAMKNEYISNGRGYVLLLSIDNDNDFLNSQGSEGLTFSMRSFIRKIKNKLKTDDVYYYNPTTIAVFLPYIGHASVLNKCEAIYELSKEHYLDDGSNDQFTLTYLPVGYPRGYPSVDDFMRHMSEFYHSEKYERGKDFVYFCDYAISRSASKREFMLSVIENEFSGQSTNSVNLQPIVRVSDQHIYGAEILLRINDAHRNVFFNAEEISRIAESENKTHIITESIINFVGNMYKEYGNSTFKINEFNRIAINIDQTYLKDPNLIKAVIKLSESYNLPHYFISFEIPEDMIPDNIDKIKSFTDELRNYHIYLSVDRFTGAYIGSEKLKDLGFNEIKIARDLIMKIDKDPIQLQAVREVAENAHRVGINVAAVGVENEAQYKALREIDSEMMVQGYYFYKPLTRSDLIAAIISYTK